MTSWTDRDTAFRDVAVGIRKLDLAITDGRRQAPVPEAEELDNAASARDVARIARYREAFDRPAFSFPCIFEYGLEEVSNVCDQIVSAMATGKLQLKPIYNSSWTVALDLPKKSEFETEPDRPYGALSG